MPAKTTTALPPWRRPKTVARCGAQDYEEIATGFDSARYPYSLRYPGGNDGSVIECSFPDEKDMAAAAAELERQGLDYSIRTPDSIGGSVTVSPAFTSAWEQLPEAASPPRKGPTREVRTDPSVLNAQSVSAQCRRKSSRSAA